MNNLKKTVLFLTLTVLSLLAFTACAVLEQPEQATIDEHPIMLIKASRSATEATLLEFACLNRETCPAALEVAGLWSSTPSQPGMTHTGRLYLPFFSRGEVVFVDPVEPMGKYTSIAPELERFFPFSLVYVDGYIALADLDTVLMIRQDASGEDASYVVIELADYVAESDAVHLGGLVQGADGVIHAFEFTPQIQDGQLYARVFTLESDSGNVTSSLLPVFTSTQEERRGMQIVSVASDLSRVYYVFRVRQSKQEEIQKLGMSDTQTGKELALYTSRRSDRCLPVQGYRQHGNALFVPGGSSGPLLLKLTNLAPIVDFAALQTDFPVLVIAPLGEFFLVGTANEVLVLSTNGKKLASYPMPVEFFGKHFALVEYAAAWRNEK